MSVPLDVSSFGNEPYLCKSLWREIYCQRSLYINRALFQKKDSPGGCSRALSVECVAFPPQKIARFDNLHRGMLVAKEGEVQVVKTTSLLFFEKEAYTQQKEPSNSAQKSLHLSG